MAYIASNQELHEKWTSQEKVHGLNLNAIKDDHKRATTIRLLENQAQALNENTNVTANIKGYDPVILQMVRRITPQLIHHDIVGVQPMAMPTGLAFAMKARYPHSSNDFKQGNEALYNKVDTAHSGTGNHDSSADPFLEATDVLTNTGTGMATSVGETTAWKKMGITIDKISAEAKTRQLRADYSIEIEKDLQAVHGLDARNILSGVLTDEITLEQNQEIIRTLYHVAKVAPQLGRAAKGVIDFTADTDGRWLGERALALFTLIERIGNAMALDNRRGKANFIVTSSNVATMLMFAKLLKNDTNYEGNIDVNIVNTTYAGTAGRYKVYVDPLLEHDGVLLGYKGQNFMDAGMFFLPYVPLTMHEGVDVANDFKKALGWQTRYAIVQNPIATENPGQLVKGVNPYYYKASITNIK